MRRVFRPSIIDIRFEALFLSFEQITCEIL